MPKQPYAIRHELLNQRRKQLGFTLDNIAAHVGVSRQAVIQWSKGVANPGAPQFLALTRLLQLDPLELADVTEPGLRDLRMAAGLTTRQCAERLQMPATSYRALESGQKTPTASEIQRLSETLNVSPDVIAAHTTAQPDPG